MCLPYEKFLSAGHGTGHIYSEERKHIQTHNLLNSINREKVYSMKF